MFKQLPFRKTLALLAYVHFGFLTSALFPAAAEPLVLSVGTFHLPPYAYSEDNGKIAGSSIDTLQKLAGLAGLTLDLKMLPWKRAMVQAEAGELDALYPCAPRPERARAFLFTQTLGKDVVSLVAKRSDDKHWQISSINDIKRHGASLVVLSGGAIESLLKRAGIKNYITVQEKDPMALMVHLGRVDFALEYQRRLDFDSGTLGLVDNIITKPLAEMTYGLCLSRLAQNIDGKMVRLNAAIQDLQDTASQTRVAPDFSEER
ncbi:ABC transporter substrate-binding protein [Labrenzia sp. PHM005]|uniref:substrate-binding periplasmic protein n=1 Tax=Labrenzia sp. PHM005 TaxID=2590016 RepID=UPI00114067AB|nr:transporter substrate-binding domain-containing protein [Labrenzia sp. PHM005]QDG77619.1 transporter substrate-binding domain-containing protein [Labrenzia sp. PHM005]